MGRCVRESPQRSAIPQDRMAEDLLRGVNRELKRERRGLMIVYCDDEECKWNADGMCQGPKHPAGHTALYIERNWKGNNCCTDFEEKDE